MLGLCCNTPSIFLVLYAADMLHCAFVCHLFTVLKVLLYYQTPQHHITRVQGMCFQLDLIGKVLTLQVYVYCFIYHCLEPKFIVYCGELMCWKVLEIQPNEGFSSELIMMQYVEIVAQFWICYSHNVARFYSKMIFQSLFLQALAY